MTGIQLQKAFSITHASDVSAARRYSQQIADGLGFDETEAGRAAILVTEAATNILKHAGNGMVFLTPVRRDQACGIEIIALDRGPGIVNLDQCLRDGMSTAGTAGTGLGAMRRLAHEFDLYSHGEKRSAGTALYLCLWRGLPVNEKLAQVGTTVAEMEGRLRCGAICVPVAGEQECGDAWAAIQHADGATLLVADGLGHGPDAALASRHAVECLRENFAVQPAQLLNAMHQELRITRGAAVAVAKLDAATSSVSFAGVGNISAVILDAAGGKQLVSHNGIVGHNMRKVQEFTVPWPEGAFCIMCSDGIGTQWNLDLYPGLIHCHPSLIAGVLYRDFARERDDATVLVARRLS